MQPTYSDLNKRLSKQEKSRGLPLPSSEDFSLAVFFSKYWPCWVFKIWWDWATPCCLPSHLNLNKPFKDTLSFSALEHNFFLTWTEQLIIDLASSETETYGTLQVSAVVVNNTTSHMYIWHFLIVLKSMRERCYISKHDPVLAEKQNENFIFESFLDLTLFTDSFGICHSFYVIKMVLNIVYIRLFS